MEFNLIARVPDGQPKQLGDEEINGKLWRVTGPFKVEDVKDLKFHCVSYVWGEGIEAPGSFFNCKRSISNRTKPALAAAIKASWGIQKHLEVEAFWIDAICIPQAEGPARLKTLESMGFIYSAAKSVLIILNEPAWKVIQAASTQTSTSCLSLEDMATLEADKWISRVWTYQELVNCRDAYFATTSSIPDTHVVHAEILSNIVGYSIQHWKKGMQKAELAAVETFSNLGTLEDTLADRLMAGYLERPILGILSNLALRAFDTKYPANRLLAGLGALTQDASWGPPSTTLWELADKIMCICEAKNDYSFIYTSDERDSRAGLTWRPKAGETRIDGLKPTHLIPIINWHIVGAPFGETQRCRKDSEGLWLEKMIRLHPATKPDAKVLKEIDEYLYGYVEPERVVIGIFERSERHSNVVEALQEFMVRIGFTGRKKPAVFREGYFFFQEDLGSNEEVEFFAASNICWKFGAPGLANRKDEKGKRTNYCAGVFVGLTKEDTAEPVLLI